ncbi:Acyltransferase 3 domain-containing protein [Mesobacillus thioparans]
MILQIVIGKFQQFFETVGMETYRLYPWSFLSVLLYFPLGVYLGIPGLLKETRGNGKWKINWLKIFLISIPFIYISFFWFIPFTYPIPDFLVDTHLTFKLAMIGAGFTFMNSIKKENSG